MKLPVLELHPRTHNWISGVVISLLALIFFLSLVGTAGPVGDFIARWLRIGFGWGAWLMPLLFVLVAALAFRTQRRLAGVTVVGGGFILVAFLALLTIFWGEEARHGGAIGTAAALPIVGAFGSIASSVIFLGMGAIGFAILLNYPADRRQETRTEEGTSISPLQAATKATARAGRLLRRAPSFRVRPLERRREGREEGLRDESEKASAITPEQKAEFLPQSEAPSTAYELPPADLLDADRGRAKGGDIRANMAIIKRTFANFGVAVEMGEVTVGPTLTQYTLKPAEGVKLSQISGFANDLALALAAHPIRIEAPIPGRSLVGIEVPNHAVTLVRLRNLLTDEAFSAAHHRLAFALGRDVAGAPVFTALEKMPHLLIAGATGTGKTIALNSMILSLLYRNSPFFLRMIFIDPKRVEFPVYNDIPHLLTPVIVDIEKTVHALRWAVGEMERRFDVLSQARARDIELYNRSLSRNQEPMPYLVIVIDELADIMAARGREVEAAIVRIAQMARAVGIHLVVATQRPSVEVITGLIKANITSRMAFQVASQIDSRTILDGAGAEKLLGSGDMLFVSAETSKPRRMQGAYVTEKEVKRVAEFLKRKTTADYTEGVTEPQEGEEGEWFGGSTHIEEDPLYEEAKRLVIQMRKASASYLQRRLRVGYARAARLIDLLEERGVVGPGEGAKPREILAGAEEEKEDRWSER